MATFDFVRLGIPCTLQTANRSRLANYKQDMRRIACARWPGDIDPFDGPVSVTISYYYAGVTDIDVDNIIKPILDQLNGLMYEDDIQIVEIICRKIRLSASDPIPPNASTELARGLRSQDAFVHVRAEWEEAMGSDKDKSKKRQPDRVRETMALYRVDRQEAIEAHSFNHEEVERLLASVSEGADQAIVRLYAALDAALLYVFDRVGLRPRSTESHSILEVATSRCFLEQSEYFALRKLIDIRDAILKQAPHDKPQHTDLLLLAELTHRVIVESENAKLEYDY
jgi:hypothetical protein